MAVKDTTPVTQDEFRSFANIPTTETGMNNQIDAILDGLTARIEKHIGVPIINKTYTAEKYDGSGLDILFLKRYPIVSVTTLQDGNTIHPAANYNLYADEGYITLKDSTFEEDDQNISITYVAGFGAARTNIPDDIKLALKTWALYYYKGITDFSNRTDESQLTSQAGKPMPADIKDMLEPCRVKRSGAI